MKNLYIDVGGTKTLVVPEKPDGSPDIEKGVKFPTPKIYTDFLRELTATVETISSGQGIDTITIALPGVVARNHKTVPRFGNLPWKQIAIVDDLTTNIKVKKVLVENDANLAALAEAHELSPMPNKVLYVTVSTSIGTGIITHGEIDAEFADSEGGFMLVHYNGKLIPWESVASGRAIWERYHKKASELDNPDAWLDIAHWLAIGLVDLCCILQPDIVILGGGVSTHLSKFHQQLQTELHRLMPKFIKTPPIQQAVHSETAVVYGCALYAKQH